MTIHKRFDFSKLGSHGCDRMHTILQTIGEHSGIEYSVVEMASAMLRMKYCQLLELSSNSRAEFHDMFDRCVIENDQDRMDNNLRLCLVEYLATNDRDGVYMDDDRLSEGDAPVTLPSAVEALRAELGLGEDSHG